MDEPRYYMLRSGNSRWSDFEHYVAIHGDEAAAMTHYPKHFVNYSHGGWDEDPDMPGQSLLFGSESHHPGEIASLYATPRAHHLVTTLLAMAHKRDQGDITYNEALSPYSAKLVQKALEKGLVKENPVHSAVAVDQQVDDDKFDKDINGRNPRRRTDESSVSTFEDAKPYAIPELEINEEHVGRAKEYLRAIMGHPTVEPEPKAPSLQFQQTDLFEDNK